MKNKLLLILIFIIGIFKISAEYTPSDEVKKSQADFEADRFGIFIHWGIYSSFAQGEWYLNNDIKADDYKKAARGFYPADFDAKKWVATIKDAGAKYITITSRHHDGFSMFKTYQSDFNIVDGTPFGRDILKELADECQKQGIALHFYYSHLDWTREDYPQGRTGKNTGRDASKADWNSYFTFMKNQLTELLTNYGPIRAIWFDGWWDHDADSTPFNWQLDQQYALIHSLQPGCLIGNNHHQTPFEGEDIQIFERDVPGENTAGLSGQEISRLPLETCNTMNGMWGYKIKDRDYKDSRTLIRYLIKTAGLGANLLLNIGPQANGELPDVALERLNDMGCWLRENGETIYETQASPFPAQSWGTSTLKDDRLFLHVMTPENNAIIVPGNLEIISAKEFISGEKIKFSKIGNNTVFQLKEIPESIDYIIECKLKI